MEFYIEKNKSQKTGKYYTALFADNGKSRIAITFDKLTIMKIADLTPNQVDELHEGERIEL